MRFGLRHPLKPLANEIDYTMAMILLTPVILGASLGIPIYAYLPRPVITSLLLMLIIGAAIKSFFKGIQVYRKESRKNEKALFKSSIQIFEDDAKI